MTHQRITELSYLVFNFASTVAVTFINKLCFNKVNFGFPAALCNIHFLVTLMGVEAMRRMGCFEKTSVNLKDPNFLAIVLVVGIVTPLNNTSLKLNSIGFYQVFKLLVTPMVVLLEYVLDKKTLSMCRTLCLMAVCAFVMVSSKGDLSFSTYGTICASIWVPLAAAYKVQWGRVRNLYNCSTLALMHAVLPYAICVQTALSPFVDPPGLLQFQWTKEAVFWIGLSGVAAFLVNFSGFLVMGNIGALAHVLLGQMKTAIIMIGATFIFGSRYTTTQLVGAGGAVVAIVLYSHVTVREKESALRREKDGGTKSELLPLQSEPASSNNK